MKDSLITTIDHFQVASFLKQVREHSLCYENQFSFMCKYIHFHMKSMAVHFCLLLRCSKKFGLITRRILVMHEKPYHHYLILHFYFCKPDYNIISICYFESH